MKFLFRLRTLALLAGATLATCGAQASLVTNGSFETGTINWNGAWGAYCYSSTTCAATGWSGSYLLASIGSWAWGYPGSRPGFDSTTQGLVVAGLQTTEYLKQTLAITDAGDYTLSWRDAGRPSSSGYTYYAQDYDVLIDGTTVGSFHTTAGQAWGDRTLTLALTAGARVLEFHGRNAITDGTSFLDSVALVGQPVTPQGGTTPEPQTRSLVLGALVLAGWQRQRAMQARRLSRR